MVSDPIHSQPSNFSPTKNSIAKFFQQHDDSSPSLMLVVHLSLLLLAASQPQEVKLEAHLTVQDILTLRGLLHNLACACHCPVDLPNPMFHQEIVET